MDSGEPENSRRMPYRVAQMLNPHSFHPPHSVAGWLGCPNGLMNSSVVECWLVILVMGGTAMLVIRGRGSRGVIGLLLYYRCHFCVGWANPLSGHRNPVDALLGAGFG